MKSSIFKIPNLMSSEALAKEGKSKITNLVLLFTFSLFSLLSAGAPDTLWTRTYGGAADDYGYSVQQTSDGGFIVVGETGDFLDSTKDIYLVRTDSNGDTLWTKTYGGDYEDVGYSVQQTSDTGFVITGLVSPSGLNSADVGLIRINSNGDTLWTKTYGGTNTDCSSSFQQTSDGGFIIVGYTRSFGAGNNDVYIIHLGTLVIDIQEDRPPNYKRLNYFIVSYDYGNNLISIRYTIPYSSSVKISL